MEKPSQNNAERHDALWRDYFRRVGHTDQPDHVKAAYGDAAAFARREMFLRYIVRRLDGVAPAGDGVWVDTGCNNGLFTRLLLRPGRRVIGIDYSESLLREAAQQVQGAEFIRGDVYRLPFKQDAIAAIVALGLLQCVAEWRRVFDEILRVLKPGGVAVIETNLAFGPVERIVRSVKYVVTGRFDIRRARAFMRSHSSRALPDDASARKYAPLDIRDYLSHHPQAAAVTMLLPRTHGYMHEFFWAVKIRKAGAARDPRATALVTSSRCGGWDRIPCETRI